jgi:hypothetical protein
VHRLSDQDGVHRAVRQRDLLRAARRGAYFGQAAAELVEHARIGLHRDHVADVPQQHLGQLARAGAQVQDAQCGAITNGFECPEHYGIGVVGA